MSGPRRPARELAVLLSIATRIEPELLRAVRLTVAPRLDVGAETDLWFGGLVGNRSFGSITLREDLLPGLRADLAERLDAAAPGSAVHGLWDVVERVHRDLSPALLAEEHAVWQALRGGADAEEGIDRTLRPALRALVEEGRGGIARWFAGAWERLPEEVRRTKTAWQLASVSAAQLTDGGPRPPRPRQLTRSDVEIIADHLPETRLHLVRTGTHLLLGAVADRPGACAVTVPDSEPRVVDLVTAYGARTLLIGAGETVRAWVGQHSVQLVGGDGAVYEIPAATERFAAVPGAARAPGATRTSGARDLRAARSDVTISYAGFARPWAAWLAHQLERLGQVTTMLRWDPQPDATLVDELSRLLSSEGRLLMVLDDWFFRLGTRSLEEWTAALREVVSPHADRFAAVSVATQPLPVTAVLLRPVDLRDVDAEEAGRRVLNRLGIAPSGRAVDEDAPGAPRFPAEPPEVWNIPRRNSRFTGRDGVLEEMYGKLARSAGRSPLVETRLALYGISGVGKSQIAVEYAHRFGNDYDVVWWVSATNRGAAREQLAELAARLGLPVGQEIGDRIRAVHEALRTGRPYRRWLLIFDSADDMEQIEGLVPGGPGHVLITTLSRDWSGSGGAQEIEVLPFTRVESVGYARRRAPRLTSRDADDLSAAVQDLPLLLAQTAAWLDANPMPPREYIELIRRGEPSLVGIQISSDYPMAFQTSWAITLNTLRERSPAAVELLKLFAFFAPDAIPVSLLIKDRRADLPGYLADLAAEPISWNTALRRLTESTAVRLTQGQASRPGVVTVQMHRLYHRFLRGDMTEEERDALSAAACRVLVSADPQNPGDTLTWERYADLIEHLEPAGALETSEPSVQGLVVNCVEYLRVRGEYDMGLRLCERFMAHWRSRPAPMQRTMLVLTHQHANMLRRLGRYREAEAVGSAVVEELGAERAGDDADLLRAKDGLAGTLMALGSYDRACALFAEVWQSYAVLLGARAPRAVSSRSNYGLALGLLGRYQESLATHHEVLEIRERELQATDPLTLNAATSHAHALRLVGRYQEAASRQEVTARLHEQVMGLHHPQTLRAEHGLALCLRRLHGGGRADALLADVAGRCHLVHGPRHPETLMVEADRVVSLREGADLEAALEAAETVATSYRDLLGEEHPYTVGTLGNLGLVLGETGDRRAALEMTERALSGMERAMGPAHPWALGCALNAGGAYRLHGEVEGAAALGEDTLRRATEVLGETHPLTLAAKVALADDLRALRDAPRAAKLEEEALRQLAGTLGGAHPQTLSARRRRRPTWDFEPQPI